jgi:light-regulated signal transduction histidine kinase (bacteriophytochrome)
MKEPLRKINFYNNYIVECPGIQSDEKAREYLRRSLSAVKRMSDLIDNLLTYSQINASIDTLEETDLTEVVDDIVLSHKEMIDQQEMEIEIKNLPTLPVIRFQIRQLFDNLVNNSIKYKHPDRKLVVQVLGNLVKSSEINGLEADACTEYHKISVIDNGIGFDPQYSEKIFDIFQRLSHQTGFKGSGIGLAICRKAVQNHHGFIKAIGKEEEGARFDIYIPVK